MWCQIEGTDQKVPLDSHGQEFQGKDRYRIVTHGTPHVVALVAETYRLDALTDHRPRCPKRTVE